jgi:hypothetical protein
LSHQFLVGNEHERGPVREDRSEKDPETEEQEGSLESRNSHRRKGGADQDDAEPVRSGFGNAAGSHQTWPAVEDRGPVEPGQGLNVVGGTDDRSKRHGGGPGCWSISSMPGVGLMLALC